MTRVAEELSIRSAETGIFHRAVAARLPAGVSVHPAEPADLAPDAAWVAEVGAFLRKQPVGGRGFVESDHAVADELAGFRVADHGEVLALAAGGHILGLAAVAPAHTGATVRTELRIPEGTPPQVVSAVAEGLATLAETTGGEVVPVVSEALPSTGRALERAGFRRTRTFQRKHRSITVDEATGVQPIPAGIRVLDLPEAIDSGLGEALRRAHAIAFAEHWGALTMDRGAWERYLASAVLQRRFSFVAVNDIDEVLAYELGALYRDDTPDDPITPHTDFLGVTPGNRGRGLARLLLTRLWRRAAELGHHAVSLGTDEANAFQAPAIYDRLGYRTVETAHAWTYSPRHHDAGTGGIA